MVLNSMNPDGKLYRHVATLQVSVTLASKPARELMSYDPVGYVLQSEI